MESEEDSPWLLRRAWSRDGRSEKPIHRSMEYGILNAYWMSNLYDKDRGRKMVTLEEALALQRMGLLKVSYRFLNDPAAAAAETFESNPFTPPEEHPESYYRRQIPKIVGGKIVVMDDKDISFSSFVKNTAGVLNHKEFLWRQYPKITTWGEEPYRPYEPRQNHPDFPPYEGRRYDDYDLRKAESETFQKLQKNCENF